VNLREIIDKLLKGEIKVEEVEKRIKLNYLAEVENWVKFDLNRELRRDLPEVVLGIGKKREELVKIIKRVLEEDERIILSKIDEDVYNSLKEILDNYDIKYYKEGRVLSVRRKGFKIKAKDRKIAIIAAGTADIPIAEEAKALIEEMGFEPICFYDVGVAGLHRLFKPLKEILEKKCDVVIVVAGMEGALPSVVSSLIDLPIIGVPTSVGYGFGSRGKAALMSMLQSCSLGLAVVNINNGIGAGAIACLIANRIYKEIANK